MKSPRGPTRSNQIGRSLAFEIAAALGFKAETSFDEIIRTHVEDELGGRIAA